MAGRLAARILRRLRQIVHRPIASAEIEALSVAGFPRPLLPAVRYLATGRADIATRKTIDAAERRRAEIASHGEQRVQIMYSPKPIRPDNVTPVGSRPAPGETMEFTMARVAETGKNAKWGATLYLLAQASGSQRAVELGACAGISALYLTAAPSIKSLLTVEGSAALAQIAAESLKERPNARVVNALFDDAIDTELDDSAKNSLDLVFIDGHHEKTATIHYFNRLRPFLRQGAIVIFDDISWSADMRSCWLDLSSRREFSDAVDLGEIGVCIFRGHAGGGGVPRYWDLQTILGHQPVGNPRGWQPK